MDFFITPLCVEGGQHFVSRQPSVKLISFLPFIIVSIGRLNSAWEWKNISFGVTLATKCNSKGTFFFRSHCIAYSLSLLAAFRYWKKSTLPYHCECYVKHRVGTNWYGIIVNSTHLTIQFRFSNLLWMHVLYFLVLVSLG